MLKLIFNDDFSSFPIGSFTSDYFATQEYHYFPVEGYTGAWYEAAISHKWRPCTAGIVFIYQNNREYYSLVLEDGKTVRLSRVCHTKTDILF